MSDVLKLLGMFAVTCGSMCLAVLLAIWLGSMLRWKR